MPIQNSLVAAVRGAQTLNEGITVEQVDAAGWDALIGQFDDAVYDQTNCYSRALWRDAGLSRILVRRGEALVGGAVALLLSPPGLDRGLAYVKFGPVCVPRGQAFDPVDARIVLQAVKQEYAANRGRFLTVLPQPRPDTIGGIEAALHDLGFRQKRVMQDPNRYLVDVALDADAQRESLQQKWRYNLKKAAKHPFEISAGRDAGDLDAFMRLYGAMLDRKQFNDTSGIATVPSLLRDLPPAARPAVVLARIDGAPVAGAIVGAVGDTASYLFGASDDRALPMKAGYALQWWIVNWLRDEGLRWYDLGGEAQEPGLKQFKKGLVGKRGVIVEMPGEFDYCENPMSEFIAGSAFLARAARRSAQEMFDRLAGRRR
jgi:hypothetical protein